MKNKMRLILCVLIISGSIISGCLQEEPTTMSPATETLQEPKTPSKIPFFGIEEDFIRENDLVSLTATDIRELGVGIARTHGGPFVWENVEPEKGRMDFTLTDEVVKRAAEAEVTLLASLWPYAIWDQDESCKVCGEIDAMRGRIPDYRCPPQDMEAYTSFVTEMVERYDGDENFGSHPITEEMKITIRENPVIYWEIANEVDAGDNVSTARFFQGSIEEYVTLLKRSYTAIKTACEECQVIIAAPAGPVDLYYSGIFSLGGKEYFDIYNIHCPVEELEKALGTINRPVVLTEAGGQSGIALIKETVRMAATDVASAMLSMTMDRAKAASTKDTDGFLLDSEGARTETYRALQMAAQELGGFTRAEKLTMKEGVMGVRVYFAREKPTTVLFMDKGPGKSVTVSLDGNFAVKDYYGKKMQHVNELTLEGENVYFLKPSKEPAQGYTLSITIEGKGTVDLMPEKERYEAGESVTLKPVPAEEYQFAAWMGPDGGEVTHNTLVMNEEKAITAVFTQVPSREDLAVPRSSMPPFDPNIQVASGWEGTYFIPPGNLLTPAHLFIDSQGRFIVNEVGPRTVARIKDGTVTRYIDAAEYALFTIAMDAEDNIYIWDNHIDDDAASLFQVSPTGEMRTLVENSPVIGTDWDTGIFTASPSGEIYMCTFHGETCQLLNITQNGEIKILDENFKIRPTNMTFSEDSTFYITTTEEIYQIDTATGEAKLLIDKRKFPELGMHAITHGGFCVHDGSFYITDGSRLAVIGADRNARLLAQGFTWAQGIAVDEEGVYIVSRADGGLYKIANNTIECLVPPTMLSTPYRMAFNAEDDLYVYQMESLRVSHFTADGEFVEYFSHLNIFPPLGDLTVDQDGSLWVTSSKIPHWPNLPMQLIRIEKNGERTVVIDEFGKASAVASYNEECYVSDTASETIYRVSPSGERTLYITNIHTLVFDFDAEGTVYAITGEKQHNVLKIQNATEVTRIFTTDDTLTDLVVTPSGRIIVATAEAVYEITDTDTRREIVSGLQGVMGTGLAVDSNGVIYVCKTMKGYVLRLEKTQ